MAKSSKPDKPAKGKSNKAENTDRFPALQKVVDEYFTNWPTDQDNDKAAGGGK